MGRGDFMVADNGTLQPATCYNEFVNGVGEIMEDDGILPLTTCIIEESADISSPRLPGIVLLSSLNCFKCIN